ncbi:cystatin-like [Mantella aurantiaca]
MAGGLCLAILLSLFSLFAANDEFPGAPQKIDPNDQDVLKAATFAVNLFNQQSKKECEYKLVNIVSADSQIVAGVIYTLNVEIGKTDCKKDTTSDVQSCNLMHDSHLAQTLFCTFRVLEVPWEHVESLLSFSCKAH